MKKRPINPRNIWATYTHAHTGALFAAEMFEQANEQATKKGKGNSTLYHLAKAHQQFVEAARSMEALSIQLHGRLPGPAYIEAQREARAKRQQAITRRAWKGAFKENSHASSDM